MPFRPALHVETWLEAQRSCRFDRILGHVGFSIIGQPFDRNKRSTQDVASIALYEDSPNNCNKLKVSRRPATFELNKRRADTKRLQKDSGGGCTFLLIARNLGDQTLPREAPLQGLFIWRQIIVKCHLL